MKALKTVLIVLLFDISLTFYCAQAQEWSEPVQITDNSAQDRNFHIEGSTYYGNYHLVWERSYGDSTHLCYRTFDTATLELGDELELTSGPWMDCSPQFNPAYSTPSAIFFRSDRTDTFCVYVMPDPFNNLDSLFLWLYSDEDIQGLRVYHSGGDIPDPYLTVTWMSNAMHCSDFFYDWIYMQYPWYLDPAGTFPVLSADAYRIAAIASLPYLYHRQAVNVVISGIPQLDVYWRYSLELSPYEGVLQNSSGMARYNPTLDNDGVAFEQETPEGTDIYYALFNETSGLFEDPVPVTEHSGDERNLSGKPAYMGQAFQHNWNGNWDIGFIHPNLIEPETVLPHPADDEKPCLMGSWGGGYHLFWESNRDGNWNIYYSHRDAVGVESEPEAVTPEQFSVSVHPNPGNAQFSIDLNLPVVSETSVQIFDISGKLVDALLAGELLTGAKSLTWNAANQPSGLYFVRVETDRQVQTSKLVLLK